MEKNLKYYNCYCAWIITHYVSHFADSLCLFLVHVASLLDVCPSARLHIQINSSCDTSRIMFHFSAPDSKPRFHSRSLSDRCLCANVERTIPCRYDQRNRWSIWVWTGRRGNKEESHQRNKRLSPENAQLRMRSVVGEPDPAVSEERSRCAREKQTNKAAKCL